MSFIQRLFDTLQDALQARPSAPAACKPPAVGTGLRNEVQIEIGGVPNLFRDEGERIVHFLAGFDARPTQRALARSCCPIQFRTGTWQTNILVRRSPR
ncbi:hypothetical protein AU476_05455 [Cupriavidus sp. UYMSc13B]|nr:hypothetical protein AU476_05455 [Cupriavidus sp. UYMSc13B]